MSARQKRPAVLREAGATESLQQRLSLPLPEEPQKTVSARSARRLWFCIHLPALPLEALHDEGESQARAVFAEERGVRQVVLANKAAQAVGVVPGLAVNAALALAPELELLERDCASEQQQLRELATWAEQFTSFVCIEPPTILLLEIAGSVRLFGGLLALRKQIATGLEQMGLTSSLAIAPTPLAATWLARARRRICVRSLQNLVGAISSLPLRCLEWPEKQREALQGMGLSRIGDCLRLPRQGFAKRFGSNRLLELDRATGRLPDPRVHYRSPEQFSVEYELEEEQSDSALIMQGCEQLLQELARFLLTRQLAVQQLEFQFFHLDAAATQLRLGSANAGCRASRWLELLEIKFDRLSLAAPVVSIRLSSGKSQPLVIENEPLPFSRAKKSIGSKPESHSLAHFIERLSARIGDELIQGVNVVQEHRPQYAWQAKDPLQDVPNCPAATYTTERFMPQLFVEAAKSTSLLLRRPLWVLAEPQRLTLRQGKPLYGGMLDIVDGPERIESGWWDDDSITRDYYIAMTPRAVCLWIYQNRSKANEWFLHGIFG